MRTSHVPYQIPELARQIEHLAGKDIADQVMAGSETITDATQPDKTALWLKGAIDRLDALADQQTREQVLFNCGTHCAIVQHMEAKARVRRRKFPTLEAYLSHEQDHPSAGSRLVWDGGNSVHQFYTPRTSKHPMRCYCHLLRRLPEGDNVSPTYCNCSRGFAQSAWEAIVGGPVQVEVVRTCASGADECEFAIHW